MAQIKENQPVIFDEDVNACSTDDNSYVQIVDNTDETQFQLGLTLCNGAEQLLPSPNFEDPSDFVLGTNWVITPSVGGDLLCAQGLTASGVSLTYVFDPLKYYSVTINVESVTSGSFNVYLGSTLLGSFDQAGVYTFHGFPTIFFGTYILFIVPENATDECCLASIESYEYLTNFIVPIYDKDGDYVDEISYNNDPDNFTFAKDSVTVTIDWADLGLSNECYYLCLLDPCINTNGQNYPAAITNGTFTGSLTGWIAGANWSYGGSNNATGTYSGVAADDQLAQADVFVNYTTTYSIDIEINSITCDLQVYFGTNLVATINSSGTHTITGVANVNLGLYLIMSSAGSVDIETVSANVVATADYECDYTSNSFNLADYSGSCPETLLVNACNDEDGLGFVYEGSGFSPRIRLEAKLRQSVYNFERQTEENSEGKIKVAYCRRRKSKNLVADLLPEYVHDFLSTLVAYDRFYVDGVAYIVDEAEYTPTYDTSQDDVGSISIGISEQTQLVRNVNCGADERSCAIGAAYLLQADDNSQNITLVNGELIEING